jgi:hypothetical protein
MKTCGDEVWELGEALMGYHLGHRDVLGDSSEMSFMEMSEISGVPVRDIMAEYNSAKAKIKILWTKTT